MKYSDYKENQKNQELKKRIDKLAMELEPIRQLLGPDKFSNLVGFLSEHNVEKIALTSDPDKFGAYLHQASVIRVFLGDIDPDAVLDFEINDIQIIVGGLQGNTTLVAYVPHINLDKR